MRDKTPVVFTLLLLIAVSCQVCNTKQEEPYAINKKSVYMDASYKKTGHHLVIMAGQSNMNGRGSLADQGYYPRWESHNNMFIWDNKVIPNTFNLLVPGSNTHSFFSPTSPALWGPEMQFAHLAAVHATEDLYILKMASDGSLVFYWPGVVINNTWHPNAEGHQLYDEAIIGIDNAVFALGGWSNISKVSFFWYQGESEALYPPITPFYLQHTQETLAAFQAHIQAPVEFYRVLLHSNTHPVFVELDTVRQDQMSLSLPGELINIDTAPLGEDQLHLNSTGCDMLGAEMFKKWYDYNR